MRLPVDVDIPWPKLINYLLVPRPSDDKAKFLTQAGFSGDNPEALMIALKRFAVSAEAIEDGANEYGIFLRQEGTLSGPNGKSLCIVAVWLLWHVDGSIHFVTLKPSKEKHG